MKKETIKLEYQKLENGKGLDMKPRFKAEFKDSDIDIKKVYDAIGVMLMLDKEKLKKAVNYIIELTVEKGE